MALLSSFLEYSVLIVRSTPFCHLLSSTAFRFYQENQIVRTNNRKEVWLVALNYRLAYKIETNNSYQRQEFIVEELPLVVVL